MMTNDFRMSYFMPPIAPIKMNRDGLLLLQHLFPPAKSP